MPSIVDRIRKSVNVFLKADEERMNDSVPRSYSGSSFGAISPSRTRMRMVNDKNIIASIYTRLSIDAASVPMKHVRQDENEQYLETIKTNLNSCLTLEANIDQAARHFRQDIFLSLFDKGTIAIVPVDTDLDPRATNGYDVLSMRVGEVVAWYPRHVRVNLYDERTGKHQEITVSKRIAAIVENPLYQVMNESNSTLQRLIRKLAMLDSIDEQAASGKLDLIIQLPYVIKSDARRQQAEERRADIERQLRGAQYGIAYTDGTEKVTQLNRPAENNMLKQIEVLTEQVYAQLGLTASVFDGTADEATMLNYHNRTIEPLLAAVTEAMTRTFLSATARTKGEKIDYIMDPFRLVPISELAELGDKLTRNEILSSNEFRGIFGFKPSKDPKADVLANKNLPGTADAAVAGPVPAAASPDEESVDDSAALEDAEFMDGLMTDLEKTVDGILAKAGGEDG